MHINLAIKSGVERKTSHLRSFLLSSPEGMHVLNIFGPMMFSVLAIKNVPKHFWSYDILKRKSSFFMLFPNEHVHLTHVYVLHLFIILVQTNTSWILIVLKCVFLRYRIKQKGGVHGKDISFLEYPCSIGKFVSYHALSHSYRTFFLQTFPIDNIAFMPV